MSPLHKYWGTCPRPIGIDAPCPHSKHIAELSVVTIIDAGRTTSYSLNSGVIEPNRTKFLHNDCTEIIDD